ncbi:MAG: hypothetical protein IJD38_11810 [Clostridia bacterium]|nr:hypothetical protein [Clostridia bacterium]
MSEQDHSTYHFTESSPEDRAMYAREAARMIRAYRVRGRMIPLVGVLTSLLFTVLVPLWCGSLLEDVSPGTALVGGVLLSLLAIPFHLLGGNQKFLRATWVRTLLYGVGILINTLGTSLCMTAYYIHLDAKPTPSALSAGVLASVLLYGIVCLLIQVLPDRYGLGTGITALLTVALMVVCIIFWVRSDSKVLFSFGCFNLIWTLITVIALHVSCSDDESPWLRFTSFASFGLLMAVASVVLLVLICAGGDGCDCDCGDGCDCDCGGACDGCGGEGQGATKPKRGRRRSGM